MATRRIQSVSTDKLLEDLRLVVHDAEELVRATAGQAGEKVAAVRAKAEASLKAAREQLEELSESALERARQVADGADSYVRNNPWQSVGIGAAVGLLVGFLAGRR